MPEFNQMAIETRVRTDVPPDQVSRVIAAFNLSDPKPVRVEAVEQPNGLFTVTATFEVAEVVEDVQGPG